MVVVLSIVGNQVVVRERKYNMCEKNFCGREAVEASWVDEIQTR